MAEFYERVEMLKERLDRPAISTDLIVGFPGESEADFEETAAAARRVGFSRMHVFGYSARRGTASCRMQGALNKEVIKERSERLREVGGEIACEYRQQFIGERCRVLVESVNGQITGHAERYFDVFVENSGREVRKNEVAEVELVENTQNGAIGRLIN